MSVNGFINFNTKYNRSNVPVTMASENNWWTYVNDQIYSILRNEKLPITNISYGGEYTVGDIKYTVVKNYKELIIYKTQNFNRSEFIKAKITS